MSLIDPKLPDATGRFRALKSRAFSERGYTGTDSSYYEPDLSLVIQQECLPSDAPTELVSTAASLSLVDYDLAPLHDPLDL
jgi:hypothetical protein